MNKAYYLIVPFDPVTLSVSTKAPGGGIFGFFEKGKGGQAAAALASERQLDEHIEQLEQRANHVVSGLHPLELRAVPLNNEELIELFYNLYNPSEVEKRELEIAKGSEQAPAEAAKTP